MLTRDDDNYHDHKQDSPSEARSWLIQFLLPLPSPPLLPVKPSTSMSTSVRTENQETGKNDRQKMYKNKT